MNITYRHGPAQWVAGPSSWSLEMLAASVGKTVYDCDKGVGIVLAASAVKTKVEVWARAKRNQTLAELKAAILAVGNSILEEDPVNRRVLIARST